MSRPGMVSSAKQDPNDARDDEELAAIAQILQELPENHRARLAFLAGASTLTLIELVDRQELAKHLSEARRQGLKRAALAGR
jgi:hypothetical protein